MAIQDVDKFCCDVPQNDLGLATANSLAGALNWARQLECTINGMDKRAGNMSLEDIAGLDVYTWPGHQPRVHHIHLKDGHCQPHKAIFGANAFQHESGIHQEGTIKDKSTYEIMTPNSVGLTQGDSQSGAGIVFGKHSGHNVFDTCLCELEYNLNISKLNAIFARFREVADKKKGRLDDDNLESLVSKQAGYVNDL